MDDERANVVRVRLERRDLFRGVVVVDAELEVVGTAGDSVLAGNEAPCPEGDIGEFECFDNGLE